jgi:hypothetical protein
MTEYKVGDLVEAVKGENIVRGRLTEDACTGDLYMHGWCIKPLLRDGYTVTLVEAAPEPLPTEPGAYLDDRGNVVQLTAETTDYEERWFNEYGAYMTHTEARDRTPFTRLEPVSETASRVINRLVEQAEMHGEELWGVQQIKNDFGVTP